MAFRIVYINGSGEYYIEICKNISVCFHAVKSIKVYLWSADIVFLIICMNQETVSSKKSKILSSPYILQ